MMTIGSDEVIRLLGGDMFQIVLNQPKMTSPLYRQKKMKISLIVFLPHSGNHPCAKMQTNVYPNLSMRLQGDKVLGCL